MRIVHLSDLHFGTSHHDLRENLTRDVHKLNPDLVVISGDFTQVASREEFQKSYDFIHAMPCQVFSVPGNHDMPRLNFIERFLTPFKRYKNYVADDLDPTFENEIMHIVGINTARPVLPHWNWANGAISGSQIDSIRESFAGESSKLKILVLHHPLQKSIGVPTDTVVFGGKKALEVILDLKVDLVLSGHVHHASITKIKDTVFVGASTALSSRLRRQENGYNVIDIDEGTFKVTHLAYKKLTFEVEEGQSFEWPAASSS